MSTETSVGSHRWLVNTWKVAWMCLSTIIWTVLNENQVCMNSKTPALGLRRQIFRIPHLHSFPSFCSLALGLWERSHTSHGASWPAPVDQCLRWTACLAFHLTCSKKARLDLSQSVWAHHFPLRAQMSSLYSKPQGRLPNTLAISFILNLFLGYHISKRIRT